MSIDSLRRATAVLATLLIFPAIIEGQDAPKRREFASDLGFVNTSGNSEVTTFNFGEKLILRAGRWEQKQLLGSVYGSQDGKRTSNLLFANWRSDFALNKSLALFGFAGYDRNTFAGISRRFEEAAGLAAKLLKRDSDQWTMEVGLAMNQQRSVTDSALTFVSLRSGTAFRHNFSKASYVVQTVEFLPSLETSEDYRVNSETAFVAPISTHISMKVGYVVRYDNLPEPGKLANDRILTSGLQFNW
jgi:putative salt-induced outer membrane protein